MTSVYIVKADLIRGADFSLTSSSPVNGLVTARSALPLKVIKSWGEGKAKVLIDPLGSFGWHEIGVHAPSLKMKVLTDPAPHFQLRSSFPRLNSNASNSMARLININVSFLRHQVQKTPTGR
jgi:hypothetical protein